MRQKILFIYQETNETMNYETAITEALEDIIEKIPPTLVQTLTKLKRLKDRRCTNNSTQLSVDQCVRVKWSELKRLLTQSVDDFANAHGQVRT